MDLFIRENFPHDGYPSMRAAIQRGQYDLLGPNGHVIPRGRLWSQTIKPGWEVKLSLWPMEEAHQQQPRRPRNTEPQMSGALPSRLSPESPNPTQDDTPAPSEEQQQQRPASPPPSVPARTTASSSRTESRRKEKQPISESSLRWIAGRSLPARKATRR
jgi:hypothetical protein